MNDMRSSSDQLLKEKGGLNLSVVKSLVRREKEERSSSEFFGDEETQSLMYSLFKLGILSQDVIMMWFPCHFEIWHIIILSEEQLPPDGSECNPELLRSTSLSKDLHGAPPGSFIHQLAVVIGSISSVHKMAFFWQSVVLEVSLWR
jgi:Rab3 GTPase-activating protein catalytic subunit